VDAGILYDLLLDLGLNTLPTLDQWMDGGIASQNANAQFVVHRVADDAIIGFSALYELDANAGHIKVGVYTCAGASGLGIGAEACILTLNYAFAMWNVRKVYFHTTDASLPSLGRTLGKIAHREAVLLDHQFFRGRLWDTHIYAIHRSDWESIGHPLTVRLAPSRPTKASEAVNGNRQT